MLFESALPWSKAALPELISCKIDTVHSELAKSCSFKYVNIVVKQRYITNFVACSTIYGGLSENLISKGAATRHDSLVRSLAIALYTGQSYSVACYWNVPGRTKSDDLDLQRVLFSIRLSRTICATQLERSKQITRPSPNSTTRARRGSRESMHLNAAILLRNTFVSFNMKFFCRINIKPRNALPVMLDCSQYGDSRFKKYRPCHGVCM